MWLIVYVDEMNIPLEIFGQQMGTDFLEKNVIQFQ